MWARSAWNPTVFGIPVASSRSSMSFQECIPAQQISPSAARRSPCASAILPASRKVSAIFAVFAVGFSRHLFTPNSAESMRMTPPLRTPCLLKSPAIRQAILTALRNFSRCAASPIAESPMVPGQTGATSEPTSKPLLAMRSAMPMISASLASGFVCGRKRK